MDHIKLSRYNLWVLTLYDKEHVPPMLTHMHLEVIKDQQKTAGLCSEQDMSLPDEV